MKIAKIEKLFPGGNATPARCPVLTLQFHSFIQWRFLWIFEMLAILILLKTSFKHLNTFYKVRNKCFLCKRRYCPNKNGNGRFGKFAYTSTFCFYFVFQIQWKFMEFLIFLYIVFVCTLYIDVCFKWKI